MTQGIYYITHRPSGLMYVGAAKNIERRYVAHLAQLGKGKHHNKTLQALYNTDGLEALSHGILEVITNKNYLAEREQAHIAAQTNPMNSKKSGRYSAEQGTIITPEIRKFIRDHLEENGISQADFARALGTTRQTVNRFLNSSQPQSKLWRDMLNEAGLKLVAVKDEE